MGPNRVSMNDVADALLLREDRLLDTGRKAFYLSVLKDIWKRENFSGIMDSKRIIVPVDKNTNTIKLPDTNYGFSTISVLEKGKFVPLLINTNISAGTIDLSKNKSCICGCDLCAAVKNYETIEVQVMAEMPDGSEQSFTKTTAKKFNKDGSYVQIVREPTAIYEDNVHVSTILQDTETFICNLEVDENGCVCDTEENKKKVWANCQFNTIGNDCGRPYDPWECNPEAMGYNLNDEKDTIFLPSNLSYDKAIVRFYADQATKDIRIPFVCFDYFLWCLKNETVKFSDKVQKYIKDDSKKGMNDAKTDMLINLSRLTLSEQYAAIGPKTGK